MNSKLEWKPWKCHAKPAWYGGRVCGHQNDKKTSIRQWLMGAITEMEYCDGCGCTRRASDLQQAKAKEKQQKRAG